MSTSDYKPGRALGALIRAQEKLAEAAVTLNESEGDRDIIEDRLLSARSEIDLAWRDLGFDDEDWQ